MTPYPRIELLHEQLLRVSHSSQVTWPSPEGVKVYATCCARQMTGEQNKKAKKVKLSSLRQGVKIADIADIADVADMERSMNSLTAASASTSAAHATREASASSLMTLSKTLPAIIKMSRETRLMRYCESSGLETSNPS